MVAAEQTARETADRGSTEVSRRLDGCDAAVLEGLRTEVDGARQLASLLGLPADAARWDTADFAVRGIVDGLNGHNSTLWAQLAAGKDQITEAEQALRTLGFRQVLIGAGAPGTATARLAQVTPLKQHLAEGAPAARHVQAGRAARRRGRARSRHCGRSAGHHGRARHAGARRTGGAGLRGEPRPGLGHGRGDRHRTGRRAGAAGDRPGHRRVQAAGPGAAVPGRPSGAIRGTLLATPVVAVADQPGRVAGVRRRPRRGAAARAGRRGHGRPAGAARPAGRRRRPGADVPPEVGEAAGGDRPPRRRRVRAGHGRAGRGGPGAGRRGRVRRARSAGCATAIPRWPT